MPAPRRSVRARESRTRWVVLGILGLAPMTGYGLRKTIGESVGHFWQESFGQLYPALRQLVAERLVEAQATRRGPGRGGATYRVTPAGRAALAAWLAVPPVLERQRNELLLKVFFAGAAPREVTLRNLAGVAAALRAELAALEQVSRELDETEPTRSHPDAPCWHLTLQFGLDYYRMALAWIEKTQRVLGRLPATPPRPGASRSPRSRLTSRSSR